MQSKLISEKDYSLLEKIKLPPNATAFHINMNEAALKICNTSDNTVLFTTGVNTCIAALIFCQLKNGDRIIGIAHLCASNEDFIRNNFNYSKNSDEEIQRAIPFVYRPRYLTSLLNAIYAIENYDDELIEIYFAGARESELSHTIIKFYCAYVNSLRNTEVKGIIFDPIGKNMQESSGEFRNALTAGISSNGSVLLNVYSSSQPFFLDPSPLVPGFSNYYKTQLERDMEGQTVEEKKGILFVSDNSIPTPTDIEHARINL